MDFCGVQTRYENVCNHNLLFWGLFELGLPDGKVWSGGGGGGGREGPKRALSLPQILQRVLRLFSDIYEMVLLREEHLVDVRKSVNIGHLRDENHLIDVHLTEMWAPEEEEEEEEEERGVCLTRLTGSSSMRGTMLPRACRAALISLLSNKQTASN